ncbi:MAG: hypothetical protein L3J65_07370 [Robiginitomaculum sp.]|nr:hypothetical protein [Robiginitomaculum sp.]
MQNTKAFDKKIFEILKVKKPHTFYELAFREEVAASKECGCLACLTIFPATAITNWRYFLANQEDEEDFAICPACGHENTVLCDIGEVEITLSGLHIINTDSEAGLSEKDRQARQKDRETAHSKINLKTLPPEFHYGDSNRFNCLFCVAVI